MTLSKLLNTLTGNVKLRLISNGSLIIEPYHTNIMNTSEAYEMVKKYRPSTFTTTKIQLVENYNDYGEAMPYILITAQRYG